VVEEAARGRTVFLALDHEEAPDWAPNPERARGLEPVLERARGLEPVLERARVQQACREFVRASRAALASEGAPEERGFPPWSPPAEPSWFDQRRFSRRA
jgi:hypothetical protein